MLVLGVDPGKKTGWCSYDTEHRWAVAAGEFPNWEIDIGDRCANPDAVVLERPKGQGPTFPDVVEAGIAFGWLLRWFEARLPNVHWIYRYDVKSALRDATLGEVLPTNDRGVWAALKMLHGGDNADRVASKKNPLAGPLAKCRANGKLTTDTQAALAVAVAWDLRNRQAAAGRA